MAAAAVLVGLLGIGGGCSTSATGSGPALVAGNAGVSFEWALEAEVGEEFTEGLYLLRSEGVGPVTVESVVPRYDGAGLESVGARLIGTRDLQMIQFARGWPPAREELPGEPEPVEGARIDDNPASHPEVGWLLVIGHRVTAAEVTRVDAVTVTYVQDGQRRNLELDGGLTVCGRAPGALDGGFGASCPDPPRG